MNPTLAKIIDAAVLATADLQSTTHGHRDLKARLTAGEIDQAEFDARLQQMLMPLNTMHRLKFWITAARDEGAL